MVKTSMGNTLTTFTPPCGSPEVDEVKIRHYFFFLQGGTCAT